MEKSIILVLVFAASALCFEYSTVVNDNGEEFVLVPVHRVRRQTNVGLDSTGRATVSHTGTLLNNNNHHLSGTGFASKPLRPNGPLTTGGSLGYEHKPSGSSLGVGAANTRGFGTDVSAGGRYNIYNKGNTNAYVGGEYNRHFGGPSGTGKPNFNVGAGLTHRW